MKVSEFKKLIKEACKEAFREEMREILIEAVKSPKTIVQESGHVVKENIKNESPKSPIEKRRAYMELMENMAKGGNSQPEEINTLGPIPMNTATEGTSLPAGEVSMDLIMKLTGNNGN